MEEVTIIANTGKGKNKVLAGTTKLLKPNTITEAVNEYGEDDVLACFWQGKVVRTQAGLRSGETLSSKVQAAIAIARKQKSEGDSALYDQLVHLKVISA